MYGECIVKTQTFTEGDYIRRGLRENKANVPHTFDSSGQNYFFK